MTDNIINVVDGNIYNHGGLLCIGFTDNRLIQIGYDGEVMHAPNVGTYLEAVKGTTEWCDIMIRTRQSLARDLKNERNELQAREKHLTDLGQAILEKAVEHDWCGEYDEFAEEWDLPQRNVDFDVTITVRVNARDEDKALEIVQSEVGISYYTEGVVDGPEFSVEQVY